MPMRVARAREKEKEQRERRVRKWRKARVTRGKKVRKKKKERERFRLISTSCRRILPSSCRATSKARGRKRWPRNNRTRRKLSAPPICRRAWPTNQRTIQAA